MPDPSLVAPFLEHGLLGAIIVALSWFALKERKENMLLHTRIKEMADEKTALQKTMYERLLKEITAQTERYHETLSEVNKTATLYGEQVQAFRETFVAWSEGAESDE